VAIMPGFVWTKWQLQPIIYKGWRIKLGYNSLWLGGLCLATEKKGIMWQLHEFRWDLCCCLIYKIIMLIRTMMM